MKYKSNILSKIIKYNKLINFNRTKKYKCKDFEKVIKEIKNNETYNNVSCSEFDLISKNK